MKRVNWPEILKD